MKGLSIEERAIQVAQYIIETEDTVRGAAKKFGISKSSIHMEVTIQNGEYEDDSNGENFFLKVFL